MTDENEVLKRLTIDEKDRVKELEKLVDEALKFFRIESPSGRIIFQNFGMLNDKQIVAIILLGKYFANTMKMIEDSALSISEIAKESGKPMTALSGDMQELVKKGYVEKLPGRKYRIAYHRVREIFDDILHRKKS